MQTGMTFSLPAAVKGVEESEIYRLVDVHMTDTTQHNRGFSDVLAEICCLLGLLFCSSHATLRLVRAFNKVVRTVEGDMELRKLVQTSLVDRNVRSVAG